MSKEHDAIEMAGTVHVQGYGSIGKLIMRDTALSIEAKAIYAYLSSWTGAGSTAFPGMELMCHDLGVSEKRLVTHRQMLIDNGYISVERVRKGKGFGHNVYTLPHMLATIESNKNGGGVTETKKDNKPKVSKKKESADKQRLEVCKAIIEYLNTRTGKEFKASAKANQRLINARLAEGYTLDDFKHVIDVKTEKWLNDKKMADYLRPATLFSTNFESYVNEKLKGAKHNAPTITRDFTEIRDTYLF